MRTDHKPLEAVILVGGKGTRLQSVVSDRPKPMAEVAGRPFAEWLLLGLHAQGVRRVIFSTGYMGELIEAHFRNGNQWDMEVFYSRDPTPLGTAGSVRHAVAQVRSNRFLVMNGDSYCRLDLRCLEDAHTFHGACATLVLVQVDDCRRYGAVTVDKNGVVQAFQEKPTENLAGLINAGVYLLERKTVETIPEGRMISIEKEFFPQLINRGLYAVVGKGPFIDIGTPDSYVAANDFFASESLKWRDVS